MTVRTLGTIESGVKAHGVGNMPSPALAEIAASALYQAAVGTPDNYREGMEGKEKVKKLLHSAENDISGYYWVGKNHRGDLPMYEDDVKCTRDLLQLLKNMENPASPSELFNKIELLLKKYNLLEEIINGIKNGDFDEIST